MIRFTSRGAVAAPSTLQIRVGSREPGALRAGAPTPSRDLEGHEIEANLVHFTTLRAGPRTRPCTRLVLSGVSEVAIPPAVIEHARRLGMERIVMHGRQPALEPLVDAVSVRCRSVSEVDGPSDTPWTAIVPLEADRIEELPALALALAAAHPDRVVLAWPLPGGGVVLPSVPSATRAARAALQTLGSAGVRATLRGLPPCLDGSDEGRTSNRFYVDADHQGAGALLWVPDIVQYLKPDSCRVCDRSRVCDGVAAPWLRGGAVGPLEPIIATGD